MQRHPEHYREIIIQPQRERSNVVAPEPIAEEVQECVVINDDIVQAVIVQAVVVDGENYKECNF